MLAHDASRRNVTRLEVRNLTKKFGPVLAVDGLSFRADGGEYSIFGATPDQALAYALVCHMVMYLLVTVTGLVLLYRVGLTLSELTVQAEKK